MPSNRQKPDGDEQIDKEAAEWAVKKDCGLSEREEKALEEWLSGDPRRKPRLEAHQQTLNLISTMEGFEDYPVVEELEERPTIFGMCPLKAVASVAVAIFLGLLVVGVTHYMSTVEPIEFEGRFSADAYETRILADGTILELNEGARIVVKLSDSYRRIWLHRGEAHFHVAKDVDRPFVVHAGGTEVKAIGTSFNVLIEDQLVQVIVTEGRVNFSHRRRALKDGVETLMFSEQMDVGQVSTFEMRTGNSSPVVETYSSDQLADLLAWKPEILEFTSTPLGDVVRAFNKRNRIQIILSDRKLETTPIEATFRADNVLAFVRLLEISFDLEAERTSENEIALSWRR